MREFNKYDPKLMRPQSGADFGGGRGGQFDFDFEIKTDLYRKLLKKRYKKIRNKVKRFDASFLQM